MHVPTRAATRIDNDCSFVQWMGSAAAAAQSNLRLESRFTAFSPKSSFEYEKWLTRKSYLLIETIEARSWCMCALHNPTLR